MALGCAAPMVETKGHRTLLEAMAEIRRREPRALLVLFGSGELERGLKRMAAQLSLDSQVIFAGEREDLRRCYPALDLFLLPSLEEGLGVALLEAQAAGVAVVGTTAGGIPEAVREGETGLLVRPGDAPALAEAAFSLLRDESLRLRLGENARNWVEENFPVAAMVEQTLTAYREVSSRL